MANTEQNISDEAVAWVKAHQKEIVEKFAGAYPSVTTGRPVSIFMAGSPGAGKTEFARRLLKELREKTIDIDPDEVRNMLPQYRPGTAHLFQKAVSIAVERLHEHVLKSRKDFLLDGTFSNFTKARENVERSISRNRTVIIEYVFQDPLVAWDFTQKREAVEGRNIPKDSFIAQLFAARDNVDAIKQEFGDRVRVDVVRRNIATDQYDIESGVSSVADRVVIAYTKEELEKRL
jgi:predicted ABC-type ATPase